MIVIPIPVVGNGSAAGFCICCRVKDIPPCNLICNFRYAIALYAQPEYVSDYFGGLFVHEPVRFVFRVLHISVWLVRAERLAGLSLCFENGAYLTTGILGVKFIKDIDKRGHVVFSLVCTIYAVVNGNEANIGIEENHLRIHTDFQYEYVR